MKNLKIGTRLAAGFGLILALTILMTVIGISHMRTVADATRDMMQQPLAKERMISDWYRLIHTAVRRTAAVSKSADPSLAAFFADDVKQTVVEINALQKNIETLIDGDEEKALYDKLKVNRKLYGESRDKIVALKKEGRAEEAEQELEQHFMRYGQAYLANLNGMLEHQRKHIDSQAAQIEALYQNNRFFMLLSGLAVLVLGALCAWRLTRGITVPLSQAVAVAEAVAERDLTSRIEVSSEDETGRLLQSLRKMNDGLISIVTEVRQGTDSISTASHQIAAGNLDLSGRTEEQASSLEETASSMEQLTATVRQNADNARQANQLAVQASEVAQRGGGVVADVISTMEAIHGASRKIADIISVIDGIAFQTNILALNAAVEAARAGEQGRGFAVVATEVRNLAQRSAAAAKEIKGLIDDSLDKVDAGSMLVSQAGSTMSDVVDSIQRVTDIMGEISSATLEQSSGIEQVNLAIGQMDQVTQQNAALVEEAAAAASSLHHQADALAAVVSVFKLQQGQLRLA